jgi:hypothetical protein
VPAVINIDQRRSRSGGLEPTRQLLRRLTDDPELTPALQFAQSTGDEIQGVLGSAEEIVRVLLHATRSGNWWIGIGLGGVELDAMTVHDSTGEAFFLARDALAQAKKRAWGITVRSSGPWAEEYEQALALWTAILDRRSEAGWEVVEMADGGATTREMAEALAVTEQAVTKRLRVADWRLDRVGRELAIRLGNQAIAGAAG